MAFIPTNIQSVIIFFLSLSSSFSEINLLEGTDSESPAGEEQSARQHSRLSFFLFLGVGGLCEQHECTMQERFFLFHFKCREPMEPWPRLSQETPGPGEKQSCPITASGTDWRVSEGRGKKRE